MVFIGDGTQTRLIFWHLSGEDQSMPMRSAYRGMIWKYLCWERDDALIIWC